MFCDAMNGKKKLDARVELQHWQSVPKTNFCVSACASLLIAYVLFGNAPARADVLQGNVQKSDTLMRLQRPGGNPGGTTTTDPNSFRIERPMPAPPINNGLRGLVDTTAFSAPLKGSANEADPRLGLLKPAQFGNIPNSKFDLGADRNSRELTLAWEAWHHQVSAEVYRRWSEVACVPGSATLRLTVTRNRTITPVLVRPSGNPMFDRQLIETIMSLSGNPGLTFPSKSERTSVTFEADYVAATDIQPGYSWVKNDYEHVRHDE